MDSEWNFKIEKNYNFLFYISNYINNFSSLPQPIFNFTGLNLKCNNTHFYTGTKKLKLN